MPITINGSGTVTGISAGGLPDGVITRPEMGYAGAVLQVVNATYSTTVSNSTTTYIDTGLTASITPTSASSKILVLFSQNGLQKSPVSGNNAIMIKLFRGATEIQFVSHAVGYTGTPLAVYPGSVSSCFLDSPATTSLVTYKTQFANFAATALVGLQESNSVSTLTLLEIAA